MISFQPLESAGDTTAQRCLDLIARHAPRLMRAGGGALSQSCRRNTITREERRLVVRLRKQRVSPQEIAERTGMSVMSVWKVCRVAGLNRPRALDFAPEALAAMRQRRAEGWSLERLAKEFGCAIATVERRTRGLVRGPRKPKNFGPSQA